MGRKGERKKEEIVLPRCCIFGFCKHTHIHTQTLTQLVMLKSNSISDPLLGDRKHCYNQYSVQNQRLPHNFRRILRLVAKFKKTIV